MILEYEPDGNALKSTARTRPCKVTASLVPFFRMVRAVPGEAARNSVPPGEDALKPKGRLLTADTSVLGVDQ